jgi:cysteine synthase A
MREVSAMLAHASELFTAPQLLAISASRVFLRFESMKVASADAAVESLLSDGTLSPGQVIVDSSSGIYAVAMALAAHRHGLRAHIFASKTVDPPNELQLRSLGAVVHRVPEQPDLKLDQAARVAAIGEFLTANPHAHWMQQYHSDIHRLGYARLVGNLALPEQIRRVRLVAAVGSGASSAGLAQGLLQRGLRVGVHGVQPFGSVTFGADHVTDPDMIIAGIGSAIHFGNVRPRIYSSIDWISFRTAVSWARRMYRETALFAGLSTAGAYAAAKSMPSEAPGELTLIVAPDTGHRYAAAIMAAEVDPDPVEGPMVIDEPGQLRLPWCRRHFQRPDLTELGGPR